MDRNSDKGREDVLNDNGASPKRTIAPAAAIALLLSGPVEFSGWRRSTKPGLAASVSEETTRPLFLLFFKGTQWLVFAIVRPTRTGGLAAGIFMAISAIRVSNGRKVLSEASCIPQRFLKRFATQCGFSCLFFRLEECCARQS